MNQQPPPPPPPLPLPQQQPPPQQQQYPPHHHHHHSLSNGQETLHPIQNYLINRLSTTEQLSPNHFIKALPSPSPLVTPEMGERLCRMSSQHHLSDYNRFKRTTHSNHQHQHQQEPNQIHKPHRNHRHHHHHHQGPALESLPIPTTLLPLINQNSSPPPPPPPSNHQDPTQPILKQISIPQQSPEPTQIHLSSVVQQPNHPSQSENPQPTQTHLNPKNFTPVAQNPPQNISPIDPTLIDLTSNQQPEPATVPNQTPTPNHPLVKSQSVKTSQTHPMNISPVIPPELTSGLWFMLRTANHRAGSNKLPIDLFDLTGPESEKATQVFWQYHQQRTTNNHQRDQQAGKPESEPAVGKLGNLLLSSCPGKKVRMNETAAQRQATGNHRSPICRDLKSDLSRAHSIGVRAIICCLDDEELEYLGSPWPDYSRVSLECGLSVIRIPIAEGFAPQKGIKEVNEVLDEVIQSYTTQGIDVLCHCRGGVGRAGLVACCWMLKIGLINKPSLITDPSNHVANVDHRQPDHSTIASSNFQDQFQFHSLQDQPQTLDVFSFVDGNRLAPRSSVLGQVEKVIEVIRRRRSPKAIETPQQVHFIIQYANWLDTLTENVDFF